MTLPVQYSDFETYLEDSLTFLKSHSWIYNAPNTRILSNKALRETSIDWINYFMTISNENLNKLADGQVQEDAPTGLKSFFTKLHSLKPTLNRYVNNMIIDFPKNAPIGIKKKHEVVSLVPLVRDVCEKTNSTTILDFGCGLGYISQILNQQFGYTVIGVEGCSKKYDLAKKYQEKYYSDSVLSVQYVQHFITDNSIEYLQNLYKNKLNPKENVCIIGLHVCADLCVTVLDVFQKLDFAKGLVIMPCCYHRMTLKENKNTSEYFLNFPCSKVFSDKYQKMNGGEFLKRTFMRMAAQRSNENWKDLTHAEHEYRGKNCLFRAIVQEIVEEENWKIKRLKRKSGLRMNELYNIKLAVQNLKETHTLTTQEDIAIDTEILNDKVLNKWEIYKNKYIVIEAIVVLQNALQSMCENIILLDRIEYLKECGLNSHICKVTDDVLSPRCFAIVAVKE